MLGGVLLCSQRLTNYLIILHSNLRGTQRRYLEEKQKMRRNEIHIQLGGFKNTTKSYKKSKSSSNAISCIFSKKLPTKCLCSQQIEIWFQEDCRKR